MVKIKFNVENNWENIIPDYKNIIKDATKKTFKEVADISDHNLELSILLTSDEKIKSLNKNYRNKNSSTNVLSFPMNIMNHNNVMILGDIVISLDTIISESKKYKISKKKYLTKMTIHGLLHLLGYDHINNTDFKIMKTKERNILKKIFDI